EGVVVEGKVEDVERYKSAVRQIIDATAMAAFRFAAQSLALQDFVHARSGRPPCQALRLAPIFGKCLGILAAAFEAWPVAGGERGRFIEKEQLGIEPTPHLAFALFELGYTADPLPRYPAAARERLRVGMKSPAAIAHEQAARGGDEQFTERIDAILQRHAQSRLRWRNRLWTAASLSRGESLAHQAVDTGYFRRFTAARQCGRPQN